MQSRSWGARYRATALWLGAVCTGLSAPRAVASPPAPPKTATPADPTEALAGELLGMSRELSDARVLFDEHAPLREDSALEALNRAQVAFFEEDYPAAVARLLELTSRPDFQRSPGYPEALTWLGESLYQLGFAAAGAAELRRALEQRALPSAYRHTLSRYLTLAGPQEPLEPLRQAWQRYQALRPAGAQEKLETEDREVRYLYAKALFRGGAMTEAASLFEAIAEGDPKALQAAYFLGTIHVARGEVKAALPAFEAALEAWEKTRPKADVEAAQARADDPPDAWDVEAKDVRAPTLEVVEDAPVDPESVLDETRQSHARMGQTIHLALARLLASVGRVDEAVGHYRQVPPGSPDYASAVQETIWALYRRGEFARGARTVDLLLAGRGDDRTAAELALWKAHLLALAADYEGSEVNYKGLEVALDRRRDELEGDLARDSRVFPEAVLAWTAPETSARARAIEADLVEMEETLAEAREIAGLLRDLGASAEVLPGVRLGRALHGRLTAGLADLRTRIGAAAAVPASAERAAALTESANRLEERLARFSAAVEAAEQRWRARIREVLAAELPDLDALERRLADETAGARRLGMAMAVGARQRLDDYAADAHFRQIDLAWWRVDEMRRRIKDARKSQRELLAPMEREVEDFRRERRRDPIPYVDESELMPE